MEKTLAITATDTSTSKAIKKEIKLDLAARYQDPCIMVIINVTAFLDPRYKELPFLNRTEREEVIEQVEDELTQLLVGYQSESETTDSTEPPPAKKQKKDENIMKSLLGDIVSKESASERLTPTRKVRRELSLYDAEHAVELDSDPLQWWQARKLTYPLMSKLVQK